MAKDPTAGGRTATVAGHVVQIDVEGSDADVASWVARLPVLFTAAQSAIASGDWEDAELYASHHLAELAAVDWAPFGAVPADSAGVQRLLIPLALWGEPAEGVVLDFGLGHDITQYVLGVSFDEDGAVEDVAMES